MPSQFLQPQSVFPVFVLEKWVPVGTSAYDICTAAEKVSGVGTIDGATCISGLWRIYPLTPVARVTILTKHIVLGNKTVMLENVNPYTSKTGGFESQGTRLSISNLPFSYSNEAVSRNLVSSGFKLRSKIMFEKIRGPDHLLTDWRNGRRFCWIDLPTKQVKRNMKMGEFSASLYYREMKSQMQCRRCLQEGHKAIDCPNDEVCLNCKLPGHRKGDAECGQAEMERQSEYDSTHEKDFETVCGQSSEVNEIQSQGSDNNESKSDDDGSDTLGDSDNLIRGDEDGYTPAVVNKSQNHNYEDDEDVTVENETEVSGKVDTQNEETAIVKDTEKVNEVKEPKKGDHDKLKAKSAYDTPITGKVSYKDKLAGNPRRIRSGSVTKIAETTQGRPKNDKKEMMSADAAGSPVAQKGLMQSVQKFVSNGKRGNENVSPDGPANGKPESKRKSKTNM